HTHLVDLFHTDAVFAGNRAAVFQAELADGAAKGLGALEFAGNVGIIENQRMQIAVAGMKDVGYPQAIVLGQVVNTLQDFGQRAAWNGAVHAVVIGRDAPDRRESRLASGPKQHAFLFVGGYPDIAGSGLFDHLDHGFQVGGDFGLGPVHFAQQDGGGVNRVVGMDEILGGPNGRIVEHFQPGRDNAGADDAGHGLACSLYVVERGEH